MSDTVHPTTPRSTRPDTESPPPKLKKESLDKDLTKLGQVEAAARFAAKGLFAPGLALIFLVAAGAFASIYIGAAPNALFIVVAAVLGGYMALNIGANDVANNVGPAVGGRALTLGAALAIAAVFEAAGALIAGGDVVATISKNIIRPQSDMAALEFILLMMAGFLAAAMWIPLATYLGAPVSTTHSVVGGVLGSGIAASGIDVVSWPT
ncbi:MAG TPA: inorganic phosphate transporter, partial [Hyphomicrobiales bacterium]|nr:inorganic phosphate transporter [Hyphomicrobiales bacterium]